MISTELNRIIGAKDAIRASIIGKGVQVPSSATIDDYSAYIDLIEQCSGTSSGNTIIVQSSGGTSGYTRNFIGSYSFYNRTDILNVYLADGVFTTVDSNAFSGCGNIPSIYVPEGVTSIGAAAFYGCNSMHTVKLPSTLTTIGESAFQQADIFISLDIPNSVTSIGKKAFKYNEWMTSVNLSSGLTEIADECFSATGLLDVTIPRNVTRIGKGAFEGVGLGSGRMTACTLNVELQEIDDYAFRGQINLTVIHCKATTAPTLGNSVFSSSTGTLYVPTGSDYSSWLSVLGAGWQVVYE